MVRGWSLCLKGSLPKGGFVRSEARLGTQSVTNSMMESYSKHQVFPPQWDPFLTPTPSEISGEALLQCAVFPPLLSSRGPAAAEV